MAAAAPPPPGFRSRPILPLHAALPQPGDQKYDEIFINDPKTIESYPRGYPRLAAFLNSSSAFSSFRRFGVLRTRVLLQKQDELAHLEEKLNALDNEERIPFYLCSRRGDQNTARQALIEIIEEKLVEYDTVLDAYHRQLERPHPRYKDTQSVINWLKGNKPVIHTESTFFKDLDDLMASTKPEGFGMIEQFVANCLDFGQFYGIGKDKLKKTTDDRIAIASSNLVQRISRLLVTTLAVGLLLIPIIILDNMRAAQKATLWVIVGFSIGFSAVLALFTHARSPEIFSATAAFCAVMVVFVSTNLPCSSSC